jgi:hypothetical protein
MGLKRGIAPFSRQLWLTSKGTSRSWTPDGLATEIGWRFLSDAGRKVQNDLGIKEYTDPHNDPMIPHALVLKPGLIIHSVYNGYWHWVRPSIDELRHDLREATRATRPDWDLSAPGLRENWEMGDGSMHYAHKDADLRPRPA